MAKRRRIQTLVFWGFLASLATGCSWGFEATFRSLGSTVDLSGTSSEKSKLVNYCKCIMDIRQETDEGQIKIYSLVYSLEEGPPASDFVLSPGNYSVAVRRHFRKVGTLTGSIVFTAKPGHKYGMHYLYCTAAPAGWLFLEFRCPIDVSYAGFVWLKDQTTGEILKELSIGYD